MGAGTSSDAFPPRCSEPLLFRFFDGNDLTYSENLYPDKTYGQMKRLFDRVKKQLQQQPHNVVANMQSAITEQVDGMYAARSKGIQRITNFTIRPIYIVGTRRRRWRNKSLRKGSVCSNHQQAPSNGQRNEIDSRIAFP